MSLLHCPTCNSTDVRTLAAAYAAGTTDFQATSVYIGTKGNRGLAPTFGRTQTIQARLSKPPRPKEWTILGWFFLWAVGGSVALIVCAFLDTNLDAAIPFVFLMCFVLAIVSLILNYNRAREYNENVYPQEIQRWENSFVCDRCLTVFEPPRPSQLITATGYAPTREQLDEESLPFRPSDPLLLSPLMDETEMEVIDLLKAAEAGSVDAQFEMGRRCELGINDVVENDLEAAKWYKRAAECGHVEAKACLGSLLWLGERVQHDPVEALRWTREAISEGFDPAERYLGLMYELGSGVERNYAEAARLYQRCAERGDSLAQYNLASLYEKGLGVPESLVEAVFWYSKAEKELMLAQEALARLRSTARTAK